jgi:hypothetical protein
MSTRWGLVVSITHLPSFTPEEKTPSTRYTGDWVDPRDGLNTEVRGKISCLCRGSNLDGTVIQSVVRHLGKILPGPQEKRKHLVFLDHVDGGSMFLRNVGNTAYLPAPTRMVKVKIVFCLHLSRTTNYFRSSRPINKSPAISQESSGLLL